MAYAPAPLAQQRVKSTLWNVDGSFVDPVFQPLWRDISYGYVFSYRAARLYPFITAGDFNDNQGAMPSGWAWRINSTGAGLDMDQSSSLQIATSYTPPDETSILYVGHYHSGATRTGRLWGMEDAYEVQSTATADGQSVDGAVVNDLYQAGATNTTGTVPILHDDHSQDHVVVCTAAYDAAGGPAEIWIDGVLDVSTSNANDQPTGNGTLFLGGRTTTFADACVSFWVHWDRVLSDDEIRLVSADPFGLLRPNWDYITAAAGATFPDAPQNLTATAVSTSQINLSWDAVSGAGGYDIERDGSVIASDQAGTTYNDTGLNTGQSYDYRVRAVS